MSVMGERVGIVAMGVSCQTAHQIKAALEPLKVLTGDETLKAVGAPFDWLIAPLAGIEKSLDLASFTPQPEDLELAGIKPCWRDRPLYFWHDFGDDGTDYKSTLQDVASKYDHKTKNLEKYRSLDRLIIVISNTQNNLRSISKLATEIDLVAKSEDIDAVHKAAEKYFERPVESIFVTYKRHLTQEPTLSTTFYLEPDDSKWSGDDAQWQTIFRTYFEATGPVSLPAGSSLVPANAGPMLVVSDSSLASHLRKYHDHDPQVENLMRRYADKLFPFFDVGANTGLFSLVARQIGDGPIHAFEPDVRNQELLFRNIAQRRMVNITVWPIAVGEGDGTIRLSRNDCGLGPARDDGEIDVPVRDLSGLIAEIGNSPGFMKIDIEGGEMSALRGLKTGGQNTIIELEFSWKDLGDNVAELMSLRPPSHYDYEVMISVHDHKFMDPEVLAMLPEVNSLRSLRPMPHWSWMPENPADIWNVLAQSNAESNRRKWEMCITPKPITRRAV